MCVHLQKLKEKSRDRESQVKVMFSLKWKYTKGGIGHWSLKEILKVGEASPSQKRELGPWQRMGEDLEQQIKIFRECRAALKALAGWRQWQPWEGEQVCGPRQGILATFFLPWALVPSQKSFSTPGLFLFCLAGY